MMSAEVGVVYPVRAGRALASNFSQSVVAGIVGGLDVIAIVGSGLIVQALTARMSPDALGPAFASLGLYALLTLLALHAAGLYGFRAIMRPARRAATILTICALVFLVLVAFAFALKISTQFSRVWAFSSMLLGTAQILFLRVISARVMRQLAATGKIGRRILIYGAGLQGQRLVERIDKLDEPWNRIVGVFEDRLSRSGPSVGGYPVLGNLSDLIAWGRRHRPDEILVALPWGAEDRLVSILQRLSVLPANVRLCSEFQRMDVIQGRVNSQYGIPMLNAFEKPLVGWGRIWKRGFDIALAGLAMLLCLPILALIAVCVRLEGPGPILFKQKRYGFNNGLIEVYKFRTMKTAAADQMGDRLTEREDPRVTKVGALLRRLSLDELPQLLNVLRGEMSVVGPRPHAIRTTAGGRECDQVVDQYAVRHKVKPGITGWAQVNGWRGTMQDEEHLIRRVEHDLYYINNWSPMLDLRIIFRTVWVVLQGRNSF